MISSRERRAILRELRGLKADIMSKRDALTVAACAVYVAFFLVAIALWSLT